MSSFQEMLVSAHADQAERQLHLYLEQGPSTSSRNERQLQYEAEENHEFRSNNQAHCGNDFSSSYSIGSVTRAARYPDFILAHDQKANSSAASSQFFCNQSEVEAVRSQTPHRETVRKIPPLPPRQIRMACESHREERRSHRDMRSKCHPEEGQSSLVKQMSGREFDEYDDYLSSAQVGIDGTSINFNVSRTRHLEQETKTGKLLEANGGHEVEEDPYSECEHAIAFQNGSENNDARRKCSDNGDAKRRTQNQILQSNESCLSTYDSHGIRDFLRNRFSTIINPSFRKQNNKPFKSGKDPKHVLQNETSLALQNGDQQESEDSPSYDYKIPQEMPKNA